MMTTTNDHTRPMTDRTTIITPHKITKILNPRKEARLRVEFVLTPEESQAPHFYDTHFVQQVSLPVDLTVSALVQ